jgi:site-specific DNA-methyltransferase (adenine-specific)
MSETMIEVKSEVFNEDCMVGMSRYPDKYFELAIVDPPYGIGMDNQKKRVKPNRPNSYTNYAPVKYNLSAWDSDIPTMEYFTELCRVSKNQIIWGANYFCSYLPNGKGWIYWDKQMGENNFSSGEFAYQSMEVKSSSFSFPSDRSQNRIHPTQKPVALYKWILHNYAKENDKILDTHLGSGSSRIAAYDMGFDFTGFELDEDYFNAANKRFANFKSQGKLF